jgi:translation initiation factor 1
MAEICPKCGLPEDICVCGTISKEQQRIRVYVEFRKWRRPATIIEGFDKDVDVKRLVQELKTKCACGGSAKNNQIMLQGDHRDKAGQLLSQLGFVEENIEVT